MSTILLVTVTKIEAQAVLKTFSAATGIAWQRCQVNGKTYYSLGNLNGIEIFMVQSEMGTASPGGALITIYKAIEDLAPFAIVLAGIAFGTKPAEQKLGEILVSKNIMAYEPGRRRGRLKFTPHGDRVSCSTALLDKFRSGDIDWNGAKVHFGLLLSGEKLITDQTSLESLLKLEPEAIGGEMEGAGLYFAASEAKVDWILVKAIGYWDMANANEDAQMLAAANVSEFVLHALRGIGAQVDVHAADKAADGLHELVGKMEDRQIWKAVYEFRSVIRETDRYFQALRNEKLIHDILHRLQFRYNVLANEAKRFPSDETSVDSLKIHALEYAAVLEELENIPKSNTEKDSGWLVKLREVAEWLHNATKTSNPDSLERAIRCLRQVLELQPSIINTRLNTVTHMIDLPKLSQALTAIDRKLDLAPGSPGKTTQFREGIKELVDLTIQLKALVYKHDQWQQIDNELRLIEGAMTLFGISELESSWPRIKLLVGLQQIAQGDAVFETLISTQCDLDEMLAQKNLPAVLRCFDSYRIQANIVFYRVDRQLKNLCDALMKVGEPLASIMQLVESEQ